MLSLYPPLLSHSPLSLRPSTVPAQLFCVLTFLCFFGLLRFLYYSTVPHLFPAFYLFCLFAVFFWISPFSICYLPFAIFTCIPSVPFSTQSLVSCIAGTSSFSMLFVRLSTRLTRTQPLHITRPTYQDVSQYARTSLSGHPL